MKIGIIICDRYKSCAGGKCFRALTNREGAFDMYKKSDELELVGYTSCGGCPGGNIEYAPAEMIENGAEVIHFATGFVVGYPPCPYTNHFKQMIENKFNLKVIVGTHPIPQKYFEMHLKLGKWEEASGGLLWESFIRPALSNEVIRRAYN